MVVFPKISGDNHPQPALKLPQSANMGMMMRKKLRQSFGNVRRHVLLISILIIALAGFTLGLLAAAPAIAADPAPLSDPGGYFHRVFFGILAHDVDGLWSGTRKEDGTDINGEIVFNDPSGFDR
jgi:hypothetical protein